MRRVILFRVPIELTLIGLLFLLGCSTTVTGQGGPPPFADGTRVMLQADNSEFMSRCNGCLPNLSPTLNDNVVLLGGKSTQFNTFTIKNVGRKTLFVADTGGDLVYCNGCVKDGKAADFIFVGSADNPAGLIEVTKLANGKYSLKAPNGKFITRCGGCVPGSSFSNVVTAHADNTNDAPAQWAITEPGSAGSTVFSMIFASDPQYFFCNPPQCDDHATQEVDRSTAANKNHVASINARIASLPNFKGVVINGDLTNYMAEDQLDAFRTNYINKFRVYPGLGNHDYKDYISTWCRDVNSPATTNGGCFRRGLRQVAGWIRDLGDTRDFDWDDSTDYVRKGSLAYYWDIGDYRFIQLNFNPTYTLEKSVFISNWARNENCNITSSMTWLENVLNKSKDKTVILNMHAINTPDTISPDATSSIDKEGYAKLQTLLNKYSNVGAIFAGHIHSWAGQKVYYDRGRSTTALTSTTTLTAFMQQAIFDKDKLKTTCGREIPVFYNGSAIYNLYLSVKFEKNSLTWTVVDSRNGTAKDVDSGSSTFPLSNPAGCPK